nr:protein SIEVE ELEMENT OCCLUSION B-like isoform X2 [Ipomoea trifida]
MGLDEFEGDGVLLLISSGKHLPYYADNAAPTGVKMIWVPIINDMDEHIQFPDSTRTYYRVLNPQKWIAPEFVRFLKNKCFSTFQVGGDPIVISLDKRGRLVHSNALHMIFTWGAQLYERRSIRSGDIIPSLEKELRERTSGADRVVDDIDKQIHNFAREVRKKINDWVDDIEAKMKSSFRSYNYTHEREQELWIKESWNLNLLVGCSGFWNFEERLNDWRGVTIADQGLRSNDHQQMEDMQDQQEYYQQSESSRDERRLRRSTRNIRKAGNKDYHYY